MPASDVSVRAGLLLLADGRFPAGAYAHSGGLEPTIASGGVSTVEDVEDFLRGRLATAGLVAAAVAAAACRVAGRAPAGAQRDAAFAELDAEYDARLPSPAQRGVSRQLGRQLVRAMASVVPSVSLDGLGTAPHQPVVLGAGHGGLGLAPATAAMACLHEIAAGPVAAAVRLLRVDPFDTHAVLARLGPVIDDLAAEAVECSGSIQDLPAGGSPLLDLNAERHGTRTARLFAS